LNGFHAQDSDAGARREQARELANFGSALTPADWNAVVPNK